MYTQEISKVMEVRVGKSADRKNKHMLETLIDLYLLRCQVEGKSPNTIKAYTETLKRFARIAKEEDFPKMSAISLQPTSIPTWDASPNTPWRPDTATSEKSAASSIGW